MFNPVTDSIRRKLRTMPKDKRELVKIGVELFYFDENDVEWLEDASITLSDVEQIMRAARRAA